jgi:hypothetical protein
LGGILGSIQQRDFAALSERAIIGSTNNYELACPYTTKTG